MEAASFAFFVFRSYSRPLPVRLYDVPVPALNQGTSVTPSAFHVLACSEPSIRKVFIEPIFDCMHRQSHESADLSGSY